MHGYYIHVLVCVSMACVSVCGYPCTYMGVSDLCSVNVGNMVGSFLVVQLVFPPLHTRTHTHSHTHTHRSTKQCPLNLLVSYPLPHHQTIPPSNICPPQLPLKITSPPPTTNQINKIPYLPPLPRNRTPSDQLVTHQ